MAERPESGAGRLPALFISHGSPAVALADDDYTRALRRFGAAHPAPRAAVVISAHWQAEGPLRVTSAPRQALLYDFAGFPRALYTIAYPCPGDPGLARELVDLLEGREIPAASEPERGLDHGAWVPLRFLYPEARVPAIEVSLPVPRSPDGLRRIGAALAPLRDRGVLLIGSGGVVHNLARVDFYREQAPVDPWAAAFDGWVRDRLQAREFEAIAGYRAAAPHADLAVPTTEHFDPIFITLGAASAAERVVMLYDGFRHANLSMRSFALCP